MQARFLSVSLAVGLLLLTALSPVSGQTPPGSPTSTPTPLSAQQLLDQMTAAFIAKGTVHLADTYTLRVRPRGAREDDTDTADLDYHQLPASSQFELHTKFQKTRNGGVRTGTWESVVVANHSASRENGKAWSCSSVEPLGQKYLTDLTTDGPVRNPVLVGTDTIAGMPVWHVRVNVPKSYSWSWVSKHFPAITEDLYIAQADSTLVRTTEIFTARWGKNSTFFGGLKGPAKVAVHLVTEYSNYGKPVTIALPPACTGTS